MRKAELIRDTTETKISVSVDLDGTGEASISTGVGFFDHMLDQIARHALFDLAVTAKGDIHIDDHHTVEDVGIALGQAVQEALGDKRGIRRYGSFHLAMDEALVRVSLDVSGRPYLVWNVSFPVEKIGSFDTQLVEEWFRAFAMNSGITLHVDLLHGHNGHHIAEAAFKGLARSLREAVSLDPREEGRIPSTKGAL